MKFRKIMDKPVSTHVMTRLALVLLAVCACHAAALAEIKYYTVTAQHVNVRTEPQTGSVIAKINAPYTFWSEDDGEWIGLWLEGNRRGYISRQFVKEVKTLDFSDKYLGSYMGETDPDDEYTSYILMELEKRDGYVVMHSTHWTQPDDYGHRGHTQLIYAGLPTDRGVRFTHILYPWNEELTVQDMMQTATPCDEFLVVDSDGTLYTENCSYSAQQDDERKVTDYRLTERDLYMLRGNVREATFMRAYSQEYITPIEYGDEMFSNFHKTFSFSPQGDITKAVLRNGQGQKISENTYTHTGDRIKVSGTYTAEYTRKISNYTISYKGNVARGGLDTEAIDNIYRFNMNGSMLALASDDRYPPFFENSHFEQYAYRENPVVPVRLRGEADYGGNSWTYDVWMKDIKTDSHGNWTERKAFQDGKLVFVDRRHISYYGENTNAAPATSPASSSSSSSIKSAPATIYDSVDKAPEYPGGIREMITFIARNLRYPSLCQENRIKGLVRLKFVVEPDGTIGEVQTLQSPHGLLDAEARRILKLMPRWTPGTIGGRPVRAWYVMPVNFTLK